MIKHVITKIKFARIDCVPRAIRKKGNCENRLFILVLLIKNKSHREAEIHVFPACVARARKV